jgi:hypothetical protein
MLVETAFMTCRLVGVDKTLARGAVDDRNRRSISLACSFTITRIDGGDYLLDGSTHTGPLAGVPLPVIFRLPCALDCLC